MEGFVKINKEISRFSFGIRSEISILYKVWRVTKYKINAEYGESVFSPFSPFPSLIPRFLQLSFYRTEAFSGFTTFIKCLAITIINKGSFPFLPYSPFFLPPPLPPSPPRVLLDCRSLKLKRRAKCGRSVKNIYIYTYISTPSEVLKHESCRRKKRGSPKQRRYLHKITLRIYNNAKYILFNSWQDIQRL